MQQVIRTDEGHPETEIIKIMPSTTLGGRLFREARSLPDELRNGAGAYLKIALLGNHIEDWLPVSLAIKSWKSLRRFIADPVAVTGEAFAANKTIAGYIYPPAGRSLEFMADAVPPESNKPVRRGYFKPVIAVSGVTHAALLVYMGVIAMFGQFLGLKVVNKAYRKLDTTKILAPLYYTPIQTDPRGQTMPLDELLELQRREAERKRAEREKAERERAERERKAQEELLAKKEEEEKKKEEEAPPGEFGEINEKPIKDILQNVIRIYKEGKLGMEEVKFTVMLAFKIAKDGSIPQSTIKMLQSSGNRVIDEESVQILWQLGESHALGPLSVLTSNSIKLEVTDKIVSLTITGFAPTGEIADKLKSQLEFLKFGMQLKQKGTDTAELLSHLKVRKNEKRLDADLTISRAQATEMLNARFPDKSQTQ